MEGEGTQELFFDGEVLHELRGQLDEVPPHIGATQTLETGIGKHAVQRVTELVEEGLHLTQCQQGRFLLRRLGKVHHHTDLRTNILALTVDPLTLIFCHPCPTLLAFARMEVGIEYCQERAVLIENLVGLHVRMIDGNIFVLFEANAIQTVSQAKDAIDDLRQLKIGTQHLCIDIVFLQLELVRIEAKIPRLEFEVFTLGFLCELLDGSHLLDSRWLISDNQVVEQFIDITHIACHAMFQHVVGIGLVA